MQWIIDWITNRIPEQKEFDPNQPRDEQGRWTATGGGVGKLKLQMPSSSDVNYAAKRAGDYAEATTRARYKITTSNAEDDNRVIGYYLHDSKRGDKVVASGDNLESVEKKLDSIAKRQRKKAEAYRVAKVEMIVSDIKAGFYKNVPDGGKGDLEKAMNDLGE